jgi:tetratricopeptide (TPR) repeat protein
VDSDLSDMVSKLSFENLFATLRLSETMDGAIVLEETIKEIWKAHSDPRLRSRLDSGISDLVRGNKERALTVFLSLVDEDPDYGEAWNKASTCYYMLGDMQLSLEAAGQTQSRGDCPQSLSVLSFLVVCLWEEMVRC